MDNQFDRRSILKGMGLAASLLPGSTNAANDGKTLRVAFVGTGGRGTTLLRNVLKIPGTSVSAVCDIDASRAARAQDLVITSGRAKPEAYTKGPTDYLRLCDRNDIDLVINATPWELHTPVNVKAMLSGKHVATEVPAAITVEGCWQMVETAEKTGKYCTILENSCYRRDTLMMMNMLRAGLLGEPLFAEAAYNHDLREVQFNVAPNGEPWRLEYSARYNGNQYPTHPLGPMSWWMDINRGDCFRHLVSMSSRSKALHEFAVKTFGPDDPRSKRTFAQGDVNSTIIRTEKGKLISLYFDTSKPRPKESLLKIQGTKGTYSFMMDKIFLEGRSNRGKTGNWLRLSEWESADAYKEEYDHKLWKTLGGGLRETSKTGHAGNDFMEIYRLTKCLQTGQPLDIDVYDAAAWSVIVPLSEQSVAGRGKSMEVPDFTRGKWKTRPQLNVDAIV